MSSLRYERDILCKNLLRFDGINGLRGSISIFRTLPIFTGDEQGMNDITFESFIGIKFRAKQAVFLFMDGKIYHIIKDEKDPYYRTDFIERNVIYKGELLMDYDELSKGLLNALK